MTILGSLFSNLRVMANDAIMKARPSIRVAYTDPAIVTDADAYDATQIDLRIIEAKASASDALIATAQVDITTLQSVVATATPGTAAARIVWQPGGTAVGNTFTNFIAAVTQARTTPGICEIIVDASVASATLPSSVVDLGGNVALVATRDEILNFPAGAQLLRPAGLRASHGVLTLNALSASANALVVFSGDWDSSRTPELTRIAHGTGGGYRPLAHFAAACPRVRVTNCGALQGIVADANPFVIVAEGGDASWAADPITAAGDVVIRYLTRVPTLGVAPSVTGSFVETFTDGVAAEAPSNSILIRYLPNGFASPGTYTTLPAVQAAIDAAVSAGLHGTVVLDGVANSGVIPFSGIIDAKHSFGVSAENCTSIVSTLGGHLRNPEGVVTGGPSQPLWSGGDINVISPVVFDSPAGSAVAIRSLRWQHGGTERPLLLLDTLSSIATVRFTDVEGVNARLLDANATALDGATLTVTYAGALAGPLAGTDIVDGVDNCTLDLLYAAPGAPPGSQSAWDNPGSTQTTTDLTETPGSTRSDVYFLGTSGSFPGLTSAAFPGNSSTPAVSQSGGHTYVAIEAGKALGLPVSVPPAATVLTVKMDATKALASGGSTEWLLRGFTADSAEITNGANWGTQHSSVTDAGSDVSGFLRKSVTIGSGVNLASLGLTQGKPGTLGIALGNNSLFAGAYHAVSFTLEWS